MAFVAAGLRTSGQTDARPAQLGGTGRRNARPRAVVVGSLVLWPLRVCGLSRCPLSFCLSLSACMSLSTYRIGGKCCPFFFYAVGVQNLIGRMLSRMQTNYTAFYPLLTSPSRSLPTWPSSTGALAVAAAAYC